jgi:hypothetical protein
MTSLSSTTGKRRSCEIRWNEDIRSFEVLSLVSIPLFKELGTNYNDPYWYRPKNGL